MENQVTKEFQGSSSIIHERKELVPQENFNESISNKTEYQAPENHLEDSTMDKQSIKFNEDTHQKDWTENEKSNIASLHEEETKNKEEESNL